MLCSIIIIAISQKDVYEINSWNPYMYKNGKLECGVGVGWIGFSFSVDIYELSYLFFGGNNKWVGKDAK